MKRWRIASILMVAVLWASPYNAGAQHGPDKDHGQHGKQAEMKHKLPSCPVMDEPVDFSVRTITADGPVYFCCKDCIKKYEENPDKYAKKVAAQRAMLEKMPRVQVTCPLSGRPIDSEIVSEQGDRKVYFCCGGCKSSYEKDPAKYAGKLAASYTYQTRCPVMGEEINPTVYIDLPTGQRVYFCCKGCEDKLLKDPAKYAPKLESQGIKIDVDKLKAALDKQEQGGDQDKPDQP